MLSAPLNTCQLSHLLNEFLVVDKLYDRTIRGLTLDSRQTRFGYLFCAYPGHKDDGRKYIRSAIEKGAIAILCEGGNIEIKNCDAQSSASNSIPIISLPNLAKHVGKIAAKFYDHPARKMIVIGVTGTNGKTSITQFIAHTLEKQNLLCGTMGTLGIGFADDLIPTSTTTPDAITIQSKLADFLNRGAKAIVLEASSHRLEQKQLDGIDFKVAIFTNLTRDHLDYHLDMNDYAAAKNRLFLYPNLEYAIINADDAFGRELLHTLPKKVESIAYTLTDVKLDVPTLRTKNLKLSISGFSAEINTPWGDGFLQSRLLGRFNVSNLLAVLATLCCIGIDFQKALNSLAKLDSVSGRMQILGGDKHPTIVIDYAHTPDALEKVLLELRKHCSGEIWCIFGCGGERDRGKRPLMGQIAERYSDQLIITDDNPRNENPQQIVADICQGLLCPWSAKIEHDRGVAIYHAIDCAKKNDIILIAGKGHENYQLIGKEKIFFNDAQNVIAALALRNE